MSVDFKGLRRSLRAANKRLRAEPTEGEIVEILRRRARDVATRTVEDGDSELFGSFVAVVRSGVRLAFAVAVVDELRRVTMTGIPYSNEVINGLFQVRGQACSLVDVAPLLGVPSVPLEHGDRTLVARVECPAGALGVRIDEVIGPRDVLVSEVDWDFTGGTVGFVSRVLHDQTMIVDIQALAADPSVRLRGLR